ncbi:hypothetical protein OH491_09490 [Termitidicoccus mucosus]|uniref:hypothetical protein n=1 Tax=Termitidicoccus mucosus TaxID=1184151 RepID=UPI003182F4A4
MKSKGASARAGLVLQILDDASIRWRVARGKIFRDIICARRTSARRRDADAVRPFASIERTVGAVNQTLRPELVGRMTEKVVFARLPYAVQREICEAMIAGELARLRKLGHEITITPDDVETILRAGFHKTLGARPMRGAVERFLQDRVIFSVLDVSA